MPDEVEIAVSAVTSATLAAPQPAPAPPAEPEATSPYPKDPWSHVPSESTSGTLLRGAVESVYGSPAVEDAPAREDGPAFGSGSSYGEPSFGGSSLGGSSFGGSSFGGSDTRDFGTPGFGRDPLFGDKEPASGAGSADEGRRSAFATEPEEDAAPEPAAERAGDATVAVDRAPGSSSLGSSPVEATQSLESFADRSREDDDYSTSPPGALDSGSPFSGPLFGERSEGRGAFSRSPADTDAYGVGAFGEVDGGGDSRAGGRGESRDEAEETSSSATTGEQQLRGWLEPAVPVDIAKVEAGLSAETPASDLQEPGESSDATTAADQPPGDHSVRDEERDVEEHSSPYQPYEPEPTVTAEREWQPYGGSPTGSSVGFSGGSAGDSFGGSTGGPSGGSSGGSETDRDAGFGSTGERGFGLTADHAADISFGSYGTERRTTAEPAQDPEREQAPPARERQPYEADPPLGAEPDREAVAEREPYQPRRRQAPSPGAFGSPARATGAKAGGPTADSLDPVTLLRGRRNAPAAGWRRLVYKASAGLIKPGEPPEVRRRRELVNRARTPVATGHHRVAVLSLKGGVGKTTTTVGLGATLAQVRGDRVIAVDANPDRGTLSDKVELETSATVRDLLNERAQIKRYVDIRAFTSQGPSRLEILASDRDPSVSEAFSGKDYQAVSLVLENFYSICITDCGTGLLHSAMSGVLGLADQLVLVSSPSVDGARAASATLDWLEAHHYSDLVRAATVVLCSVRPRSKSTVDLDRLEAHFAARCRAVVRVPYDPHLEEGAEFDLDRLQEATRDAYLRLAASVGDGFAGPQALNERRFSEIPDHL
ncbi:MinD/ParA family protein [Microbispora sp. RL4-1S]|uniref:MinD/ParA family protein n=1 Tax=Microbispora oryzae TaxID=2806554 RepID=A0A941ALI9_9ACTN|nr:MinD/ParA family protein [Microbispora oryzae]MBP2706318.1 MinD/ParA family protein [Microbispora oryzae]